MLALAIEFRRPRLWLWSVGVCLGWLVLAFAVRERWWDSTPLASVWAVLPASYLGALIVAAAVDCGQQQRDSPLAPFQVLSARPPAQLATVAVVPALVMLGVVPVLAGSLGTLPLAVANDRSAAPTWTYLLLGVCFTWALVGIGRFLGTVISSRLLAPVLGLAVGLAVSLYASPVPPTNRAWTQPNPTRALLLLAVAVAFLLASQLATTGRTMGLRGRTAVARGWAVAAAAIFVTAVGFSVVLSLIPRQIDRSSPDPGVCREVPSTSSTVCVWPQDERFLAPMVEATARFDRLAASLGVDRSWWVTEPGLAASGTTAVVRPLDPDDGMWLVAQDLVFALANADTPGDCGVESMSEQEANDYTVRNWALLDAATNYAYGGTRPETVVVGQDDEIEALVAQVAALTPDEQVAWLTTTWQEVYRCEPV